MSTARRRPPRLRVVEVGEGRRASWLELFFDLVFVVAVAELAHVLHDDPTWAGAARFVGLSVPVIWTWMNFTFYADQFDTDDVPYRLAVFAGMLASAALAVSLLDADVGFVVAYACLKGVMVALYARAWQAERDPLSREFCAWCCFAYGVSGLLWLSSLLVDEPVRQLLWAAGLAVEIGFPAFGPRVFSQMPFSVEHIPERFGLFTIIVFGEAIVVTALGVSETGWRTASALVAVAAFGLACALWWLYFDRIDDNRLGGAIRANLVFIYGHPLLFMALNALAVGVEFAIEHAGAEALAANERAILGGGVAAALLAISVVQAATLRPPPALVLAARTGAATGAIAVAVTPLPALAAVLVLLALVAACAALEPLPAQAAAGAKP